MKARWKKVRIKKMKIRATAAAKSKKKRLRQETEFALYLESFQKIVESWEFKHTNEQFPLNDHYFTLSDQPFNLAIESLPRSICTYSDRQTQILIINSKLRILWQQCRLKSCDGLRAKIAELTNELKLLIGDLYKKQIALIKYLEDRLASDLKARSVRIRIRYRIQAFLRMYFSNKDQDGEVVFSPVRKQLFYHHNLLLCTIRKKLYIPLTYI